MSFPPVAEQMALLTRGIVDLHVRAELEERLEKSRASGKPLRVKAGFDPTRPDLHIGHAVLMSKMRQFQELGHTVILLVGEFTAMLGDPSGKSTTRPRLTRDEVKAAAKTYTDQAFCILDGKTTELRSNGEWLDKMTPGEIIELMAKTTVSRMLERNDFAKRFAEEQPIYQHEFLYPLLQGYDSVALECDIELGGTDQLFNLLVGRDIMPKYGQRGQMVMTTPILEGTDAKLVDGKVVGKKMSKSEDNYIGLREPPLVMFRKTMQIDDDVIFRYFELLSARSNEEIAELKRQKAAGTMNPMAIKALFAKEIIGRFHDASAAEAAEKEFTSVYSNDAVPTDVPEYELGCSTLPHALKAAGLVKSTSEAWRLIEQGGVEVDQVRERDPRRSLEPGRYLLRVGSKNRRFAYVVIK
jgi:tyrosyl-tRNA synthetase